MTRRARYGVDGWPYQAGLSLGAVILSATAVAVRRQRVLAGLAAAGAVASAVPAGWGAWYVWRGKRALRDLLLDAVHWRGDDVVVDLGAGAGLLAIGAARRTRGPVHAVDLFIGKDLSGNSAARLLDNAAIEGVDDRIVVHRTDIRATGLPDASVDVVVSTLCLHNLGEPQARTAALDEVLRILRPGGQVVISDLAHVDEFAAHLQAAGLVVRTGRAPGTFPFQRYLIATSSPATT